jgi:hypothetical protein
MMIILPFFIGMTLQSQDNTIDFTLSIILCVVNVITCILGLMIAYLHLCINLVKYSLITEDSLELVPDHQVSLIRVSKGWAFLLYRKFVLWNWWIYQLHVA